MADALFDVAPLGSEGDLPLIEGTSKQVPWATHVRKDKLTEVGRLIRQQQALVQTHYAAGRAEKAEQSQKVVTRFIEAAGRLERETSAHFWLDHRENSAHELLTNAPAKPGNSFVQL